MKSKLGMALFLFTIFTIVSPSITWALTVNTEPSTPEMAGKSIKLELKVGSGGVGQSPRTPLESVSGSVGQSLDLGQLNTVPDKPVELRVTLPSGSFYRSVSKDSLNKGSLDLQIHPYDSDGEIRVLRHGMLAQPFPNRLMFREFIIVDNPSPDRMAGGVKNPLTLDLPKQVQDVQPGPGMGGAGDLVKKSGQFEYQLMFPPGRTVLGFFYMARFESDPYSFERRISVPTRSLIVSIPSYPELSLEQDGLRKRDNLKQGKKKARDRIQLVGSNMEVGERFSVTLNGLSEINPMGKGKQKGTPDPGGSGDQSVPERNTTSLSMISWPLLIGMLLSLAIFVVSYAYVQYELSQADNDTIPTSFLIEELARLDQEYEDGALEEAYYKRTRRRWKKKVEDVADGE